VRVADGSTRFRAMVNSSRRTRAFALIASLGAIAWAGEARAIEGTISFEPRASFIVPDKVFPGVGLGVTGGISLDFDPVVVMPELELAGDGFPTPGFDAGTFRAMPGIRVGLALAVQPTFFIHTGYGYFGAGGLSAHLFSLDMGLSLDYRLSRALTIGATAGYETLANGSGAVHGAFIGPRLTLWIE
jgi:hypothetical protein